VSNALKLSFTFDFEENDFKIAAGITPSKQFTNLIKEDYLELVF
jgi:hypothetical protein